MSNATQFAVSANGATTTAITNLALPTANAEVAHNLSAGLKFLMVRSRLVATIRLSFIINETSTKYITIRPGAVFTLSDINFTSKTLYAQSDIDNNVLEILELS